jgi:hypothetical protein
MPYSICKSNTRHTQWHKGGPAINLSRFVVPRRRGTGAGIVLAQRSNMCWTRQCACSLYGSCEDHVMIVMIDCKYESSSTTWQRYGRRWALIVDRAFSKQGEPSALREGSKVSRANPDQDDRQRRGVSYLPRTDAAAESGVCVKL